MADIDSASRIGIEAAPVGPCKFEDTYSEVFAAWKLGYGAVTKADVVCKFRETHLQLLVRDCHVCDGGLLHSIDPSGSFWSLEKESEKVLVTVSLSKRTVGRPWTQLLQAAEKVDGDREAPEQKCEASFVIGSEQDKGFDDDRREHVDDQLDAERKLEPQFLQLWHSNGIDDDETLEVFFKLYHEKIQLYRLNDLDTYFEQVLPACRRKGGTTLIKGVQSMATVRYKQGRMKETLELMLEVESLCGVRNPVSSENIAMCYCSIGDYPSAEARFREAMRLQEAARGPPSGSALLGLGGVYDSTDRLEEALAVTRQAYNLYKSQACGRPSSLQAKSASSLARVHAKLGDLDKAEALLQEALPMLDTTCGANNPLVAITAEQLAQVLTMQNRLEDARPVLARAYEVRIANDVLNFEDLVRLHLQLMSLHTMGAETVDRRRFCDYLGLVDRGVTRVRHDSGLSVEQQGAYFKLAGELKAYSADYAGATPLLEEALAMLPVGNAANIAKQVLQLCHRCLRGEISPPMDISTKAGEDKKFGLLRPPGDAEVAEMTEKSRQSQALGQSGQMHDKNSFSTTEISDISDMNLSMTGYLEGSCGVASVRYRALLAEDFATIQDLWATHDAEALFRSRERLAQHLAANPGLCSVAEVAAGGHVIGLAVAGACGKLGFVRQVITFSADVPSLQLPGAKEVHSQLLDTVFEALRSNGCSSIHALVPTGELHDSWEKRGLTVAGFAKPI